MAPLVILFSIYSYLLINLDRVVDILFYQGTAFPGLKGGAFVSFHGSWDRYVNDVKQISELIRWWLLKFHCCRTVPSGYKVSYVPFDQNGNPTADTLFLSYIGPGATASDW